MQMIVAPPMLQQAGCMDALQCQHFLLLPFVTYGVVKGGVLAAVTTAAAAPDASCDAGTRGV